METKRWTMGLAAVLVGGALALPGSAQTRNAATQVLVRGSAGSEIVQNGAPLNVSSRDDQRYQPPPLDVSSKDDQQYRPPPLDVSSKDDQRYHTPPLDVKSKGDQKVGGPADNGSIGDQYVVGNASLACSFIDMRSEGMLVARITDAGTTGFFTFAQLGPPAPFDPGKAFLLGWAPTDATGLGTLYYDMPPVDLIPPGLEVQLFGSYVDVLGHRLVTPPTGFLFDPLPLEKIDFDWAMGGMQLAAGTVVDEQWAGLGMHVSARNNTAGHPDMAILFDSAAPTGDDYDLVTPGYGAFNDTAYGKLLIIPENAIDVDGDGLVDVPDDERYGGVITFAFDGLTTVGGLTVVDIDTYEVLHVQGFDGDTLVQDVVLPGIGDNCMLTIGLSSAKVDRLEVAFSGSGAIAELTLVPCPAVVDFDRTTAGAPMAMRLGEVVTDQYAENLGLRVSGVSFRAGGPNEVILFDSAHPTGNDGDLVTPGYHPTNTEAREFVLIIPRDATDADGDGYVDDPNDDELGGMMVFEFETDVVWEYATVLDIDENEAAYFEAYDADGAFLGRVLLQSLGDNSVQRVDPSITGVRRLELHMTGSGALVDLGVCRDEGFSM